MQPLCSYLRHIDLLAVYQQLDTYNNGFAESLGNIPKAISARLAMLLESRAESTFQILYDEQVAWEQFTPITVAAEVGDYLERDLELIEDLCSTSTPPPSSTNPTENWLERYDNFVYNAHEELGAKRWYEREALLIYQYDCLCWLNSLGLQHEALSVFEGITETIETLAITGAADRQQQIASRKAQALAEKRHLKTNEQRAIAISDWEREGSNFSSMRAFSRNCFQRYGVADFMTVYNWLRSHTKNKG